MRALALTRSFEPEYDHLSEKMKEIVGVSESLRDSTSLMSVLALILDIGNYMNDSNKQASGFKLSSLARLGMVKDDKNESTFADLIERIVRNEYSQWEIFVDDIAGVVGAQKLNVDQIRQDAKKYIDGIKNVQSSLDAGNLSDPKKFHPQDRVAQVVQRSMKDARRKADQMQLYLDEMTRTYDDIMTYFGEDNTDENARRDFFSKLAGFVSEWKKSREKNVSMEETRRRNEVSMARKRANQAFASTPASSGAETPGSPTSSGAMDSLLEKLRAAAPQARDQRDRRRRARLKEKHQVRVASGQKLPDLPLKENIDSDRDLLSTDDILEEGSETTSGRADVSESEDVADRAATLLQGLRSESAAPDNDDGELRVRRRRENADEERRNRRMRRRTAQQSSSADGRDSPIPSPEEHMNEKKQVLVHNPEPAKSPEPPESAKAELDILPPEQIPPPTIVISPTSDTNNGGGEGTAQQPIEVSD